MARLSPAEELRTAVCAGRPVLRGRDEPAAQGKSWSSDRQLPADLLYELLARPEGAVKPRAAVLVGLRITGQLNLEDAELQAPLARVVIGVGLARRIAFVVAYIPYSVGSLGMSEVQCLVM